MTCWGDGRGAVSRARSGGRKRAVRMESYPFRPHVTTSGDMPTDAAVLTVIEVASKSGRTGSDAVLPDQLSSG